MGLYDFDLDSIHERLGEIAAVPAVDGRYYTAEARAIADRMVLVAMVDEYRAILGLTGPARRPGESERAYRVRVGDADVEDEYVGRCPACGDPMDYCQGHGELGDPAGFAILARHDADDHTGCHPDGCDARLAEEVTT